MIIVVLFEVFFRTPEEIKERARLTTAGDQCYGIKHEH